MALDKSKITINYQLFEQDRIFKDASNIENTIKQAQDFYNGKQYKNENVSNDVRLTLNICKLDVKTKASRIAGTKIYRTFTADDENTDCTNLRQFDEYNCNKLHLENEHYFSAINGYVNGTEVVFYRWDDDDTTYKGIYKGGLCLEHIDLRHFAVADPSVQRIQNQEWVMFWEDYPVGVVKQMIEGKNKAEIKEKQELIEEGVSENDSFKNADAINRSLCRVYTRFFRIKGEVYFSCETQYVSLFAFPHPLSRKLSSSIIEKAVKEYERAEENGEPIPNRDKVRDYNIDYGDAIMCAVNTDKLTQEEYKNIKEKFSLYPFAVFRPNPVNNNFYGESDIKNLIPTQTAYNFAWTMAAKCLENHAYGKILVKPDTLRGQKINTKPGQVITDYSPYNNTWGIKMLEGQSMPAELLGFPKNLLEDSRLINGFNEVFNGDTNASDISGYAYNQMVAEANKGLSQEMKLLWLFDIEQAEIRLMFYKHYVEKAKYTYEMPDADYKAEEEARQLIYDGLRSGKKMGAYPNAKAEDFAQPTNKVKVKEIYNEEMYGINFDISIEAMQGLNDSKLIEQQMWDNMMVNGGLENIDPDNLAMYLESAPNVSPRFKTAISRIIESRKNSKNALLEQQLQETQQQCLQIMNYAKSLEAQIGYQSTYVDAMKKEFTQKINASNKMAFALEKDLEQYKEQEGKVKSDNSRGISGGQAQMNADIQ